MRARPLALEAFDGSPIPNSIDADPSPGQVALARESHRGRILGAREIRGPTGRYNCHGLVFASRRTNIPPPGRSCSIDDLLVADGYSRVDVPQVGDLIAYRSDGGDIEHTGIVWSTDPLFPGGSPIPRIWSMWGGLGEYLHPVEGSPYGNKVEYWRIGFGRAGHGPPQHPR